MHRNKTDDGGYNTDWTHACEAALQMMADLCGGIKPFDVPFNISPFKGDVDRSYHRRSTPTEDYGCHMDPCWRVLETRALAIVRAGRDRHPEVLIVIA
ncbi:unnamed protein product [Sphacelaria rigidula]